MHASDDIIIQIRLIHVCTAIIGGETTAPKVLLVGQLSRLLVNLIGIVAFQALGSNQKLAVLDQATAHTPI